MYKLVPSVCSYCGTGCGVLFKVLDGRLLGTLPLKTHPVNQGKLCIKGWNLHEYVNSSMRLQVAPLEDQRPPPRGHLGAGGRVYRRKAQGHRLRNTARTASGCWLRPR